MSGDGDLAGMETGGIAEVEAPTDGLLDFGVGVWLG